MPKIDKTSIVLDEVESTVRRLLLDVVEFIEKNPVPKVKDEVASRVSISPELAKAPLQLRWTGGWVRDKLLKAESKDIDIAINKMTGYQFGLRMKEYLDEDGNAEKYSVPGAKGAINAKLHKIEANPDKSKNLETTATRILGLDLDLVNLRKETYASDSRNPKIEFGTAEEDALRRDATINAMFYNIHTSLVEDFTGTGLDDLENGIIRTPLEPKTTFIDDPLRVLRLIRFATRYDYRIDELSFAAMSAADIKEALLVKISKERVLQELEKMLQGPNPKAALSYIEQLGLYDTIFMVPKSSVDFKPDLSTWRSCYNMVGDILANDTEEPYRTLKRILVQGPEEAFQAWFLTALIPWTDAPEAPPSKSGRPSPPMAALVARDGLKAPTRMSELASASVHNRAAIQEIVESSSEARDTLGMKIRSWGSTWRQQLLFSLLYDVFADPDRAERIARSYASFLTRCEAGNILQVYDLKPLINGTDLCKALDLKPGIWTKAALDVVMIWQLRNPDSANDEAALQEVRAWKENAKIEEEPPAKKKTKRQSELTSLLTSHFLQLTLRPLFSQTPNNPNLTPAGRRNINVNDRTNTSHVFHDELRPWKTRDAWALNMLSWICKNLDAECVERDWGLLIPPVLTVLDDTEVRIKTKGCTLMNDLLCNTPTSLLQRTGLGPVFEESLIGCTTYLPTLTAEADSVAILNAAYPALVTLGETLSPPPAAAATPSPARIKYFNKILRNGILAGYRHAGENVVIASTLFQHIPPILRALGIDSVVQLKNTVPLLSNAISDPFAPAAPAFVGAALDALKSVIECGWPRITHWSVDILRGICMLWINLADEDPSKDIANLRSQVKDIMYGLTSAVLASGTTREAWADNLRSLLKADDSLHGLLDDSLRGLFAEEDKNV